MSLKYTNVNAIALKLRGRLQINDSLGSPLYQSNPTSLSVDPKLIELVAEQKEAFVDSVLVQIYQLPLLHEQPLVSNIVEALTIASLLKTSFQGQNFAGNSADASGFGPEGGNEGYQLLSALTAGHSIIIPGIPPVQEFYGVKPYQPLVLPGERLRINQPDTITKSYTYISLVNTERKKEYIKNISFNESRNQF